MDSLQTKEEYLDLVDENDIAIGTEKRSEIYKQNLKNFRVANAFIKNSEGKLWIPRRALHKKIFPLHLDMSMGGHVDSGETYDEAFKRETMEELNIDLHKTNFRLLGNLRPPIHGVNAFMNVYEIYSDNVPEYNTDDYIEYFWLTPQELRERIKNGEKVKMDLPIVIDIFYPQAS